MRIKSILEIIRPQQWYKNLLIFIPLIFLPNGNDSELIFLEILGFIALCLGSGGAYVLNDLFDFKRDIIHPIKKNRPLPSGRISKNSAIILAIILITVSEFFAYSLNDLFFIANTLLIISIFLYSIKLKEIFLLDVSLISINYVFRATGGAFLIDVQISGWLILGIFFLALLLAFTKRKNEILLLKNNFTDHKKVLKKYSHKFLNFSIVITSAITFSIYFIYSFTGPKEINDWRLLTTVPIIFFILFLFVKRTIAGNYQGKELDKILIHDKLLIGLIVIYFIMILVLINIFPNLFIF